MPSDPTNAHGHVSEDADTARLAVDLARDQLAQQLAAGDSDDVKALGFLAVELAAMATLFASRDSLNAIWWLPCCGFAVAAVLLLLALRRRSFHVGPEPLEVYFNPSATPSLDLVLELRAAREQVVQVRETRSRRWAYRASLVLLVLSLAGGGLTLLGVNSSHGTQGHAAGSASVARPASSERPE